jgi:uncharacterized membrane protein (UPF0127 family)
MKKILLIISVVILFFASILIFWAGLAPKSFFKFFAMYPVVGQTANKAGLLSDQAEELIQSTSSEPVLATVGKITINNNSWNVEIVNNDTDRTTGLSNRTVLRNNKGMLFVFDKMSKQSFWMKDMLIPIDMIFLDNNWKIVLIESNLQPSTFPKTFGNDVLSQYVLEINALESEAYGLKVGDQAIFLNK